MDERGALTFRQRDIFAGAPAKSISAKNHQDLYRSARHRRCIFAVYTGRRTLLTSRKLEFGITWRDGRACDSCKRVIHMREEEEGWTKGESRVAHRPLLVPRKLKLGKPRCSFVYDLCDRVTRIVAAGIYRSRVTAALAKTGKTKDGW